MPIESQISYAIAIGAFIFGASLAYLILLLVEKISERISGKRVFSILSLIGLVGATASFCSVIGLIFATFTSPILTQRLRLASSTPTITSTSSPTVTPTFTSTSTPSPSYTPSSTPTPTQFTETSTPTITPTITPTLSPEQQTELCKGNSPLVFMSGIPNTDPCQGLENAEVVLNIWVIVEPRTEQARLSGQCKFVYPGGDRGGFIEGSMWALRIIDSQRASLPLCPELRNTP